MKKAFKALSMVAVIGTVAALSLVAGCGCCDSGNSCEPCKTECNTCPPTDSCTADWGYTHGGSR
jgi:hypothetical protein